ncbi:MAG: class I SAM-dependent methyltransferase [Bacteroidaceae bacterium]|nr:class I SAM-dependent methyltransferase [Bacteroidaceae bacterium]
MSKIVHTDCCPICGSNSLQKEFSAVDRLVSKETFDVWHCAHCGFKFTQDAPDESEIGRYYESADYVSHSDAKKGLMNKLYHVARNMMLTAKAGHVTRATGLRQGWLLDIGSGTGYFAHRMTEWGWNVRAIEKNTKARQFAKDYFGLKSDGEEAYATLQDKSFDCITLWHVLEHLQQLNIMGDKFYRWLKDDGALLIAVPNNGSADAKYYAADWAAWDVPRHLWHFTPVTMKLFAEKHGFKVIKTIPMPLDGFYVSMLTEQRLGHKLSFLRGFWRGCCAWVNSWGHKERSSSLIYVLKKV